MKLTTPALNMAAVAMGARPCGLVSAYRWRAVAIPVSVGRFGFMHDSTATKRPARHLGSLST